MRSGAAGHHVYFSQSPVDFMRQRSVSGVFGSGEAESHTSTECRSRGHLSNPNFQRQSQGQMGPAQGQGSQQDV